MRSATKCAMFFPSYRCSMGARYLQQLRRRSLIIGKKKYKSRIAVRSNVFFKKKSLLLPSEVTKILFFYKNQNIGSYLMDNYPFVLAKPAFFLFLLIVLFFLFDFISFIHHNYVIIY